jgi:hypothetical protein
MRPLRIVIVTLMFAACNRDGTKVLLTPPFNDNTKVAEVAAHWDDSGEERSFAGGRKLEEPQTRVRYRVDARNRLEDKLFVRLSEFRLVGDGGAELGKDEAAIECVLSVGDSSGVLSGDVWMTKRAAQLITGFGITHYAVPLSERAQGLYREWALQGRKADAATVDAEIQKYANAPPCPRG